MCKCSFEEKLRDKIVALAEEIRNLQWPQCDGLRHSEEERAKWQRDLAKKEQELISLRLQLLELESRRPLWKKLLHID